MSLENGSIVAQKLYLEVPLLINNGHKIAANELFAKSKFRLYVQL
jgi:hypothetical protein